jgi:ADP-dependent NAD(P)H-hydrate dehydratase / NAD(P)H-hydrate epimerase
MAKGGSGDVLTGMLTGLAAQSYPLSDACKLAVFLHGMAGDLARDKYSEHAMLASDIIEEIGPSFKKLA